MRCQADSALLQARCAHTAPLHLQLKLQWLPRCIQSASHAKSWLLQLEALEAIVEQERRARKAHEARHKLECDRLRGQITDLQVRWQAGQWNAL